MPRFVRCKRCYVNALSRGNAVIGGLNRLVIRRVGFALSIGAGLGLAAAHSAYGRIGNPVFQLQRRNLGEVLRQNMDIILHVADGDGGVAHGHAGEGDGRLLRRGRSHLEKTPTAANIIARRIAIPSSHRTITPTVLIQVVCRPVAGRINLPVSARVVIQSDASVRPQRSRTIANAHNGSAIHALNVSRIRVIAVLGASNRPQLVRVII